MDTAKAVVELFLTNDPARARDAGQAAARSEHRAPAGGGRDPRDLRAASLSTTAECGAGLLRRRLASRRARHRGQPPGGAPPPARVRARAQSGRRPGAGLRAAASPRSICWTRWNRCPSSSCDSAATRTPPASPWKSPTSTNSAAASTRTPPRGFAPDDFLRRAGDRCRARIARDQRAGRGRALHAGAVRPRQPGAAVRRAGRGSGWRRRRS